MTREIKFRGIYNDVFVYGNLIQGVYDGRPFTQIENTDNNDFQKWEVNPKTVGQLTGLKDKNGVEIYEGDIVDKGKGEIFFDTKKAQFRVRWHDPIWLNVRGNNQLYQDGEPIFGNHEIVFEVIGNIYQNTELLTDKHKQTRTE